MHSLLCCLPLVLCATTHDGLEDALRSLKAAFPGPLSAAFHLSRAEIFVAHAAGEEALAEWYRAAELDPAHPELAPLRQRIQQAFLIRAQAAPISVGRPHRPPAASTTLLPAGATWRYLDDGSDGGLSWQHWSMDDSLWASGPAQLGYGDGDEATVVSFGGNANNKYVTTYFRATVDISDPSAFRTIELRLLRDDGALVYLNGVEIVRTNMPNGAIGYQTLAPASVASEGEDAFYSFYLDPSQFQTGLNLLAVEVHQSAADSSDISFDLELIGHTEELLVRGPYLQKGSSSAMVVRWRTAPATDSRVAYGTSPNQLTAVAEDLSLTKDHEILLSNLPADTQFYYSIGTTSGQVFAGADLEHYFFTAPPPGSARPTRIWVVGDAGTASSGARAVRDAYENFTGTAPTHLWLMLGDNAYESGLDEEYQRAVFDTYAKRLGQSVLWPARGNHEKSLNTYTEIFSLPTQGESGGIASGSEAYYSLDYGNLHFVCLDSFGSDRSQTGPMYDWLVQDLASSQAEWLIAYWHHPPYSKGSHDSDTEIELREMRENFLPLLEAHGVDLVLCGHSHSYERSYMIDGHYGFSVSFDESMKQDPGDGRVTGGGAYNKLDGPNRGTVYCVAGASGQIDSGPLNHPAMVYAISALGSLVLDVDQGRLDVRYLRSNGQTFDTFRMLSEQWFGTYCAPSSHSEGCVASMVWSGTPSASSNEPFWIEAQSVVRNQFGILFYGHEPSNAPFFGSKRCVAPPIVRTPPRNSGTGPFPCDGKLSFDFNAHIQSGLDSTLVPGARVYAQYWFRDPMGASGSSTSDALQFTIQP